MEGIMDKMAAKNRTVDGKPTSFVDLGYNNCGLDDNWQACGAGVSKSFDDKDGNPLINTKTFPDMKKMTDHGHNQGIRVGWYMNNCICSEHEFKDPTDIENHYKNHVAAIVKYGKLVLLLSSRHRLVSLLFQDMTE
jgi:alpha-galactosidase